MLTYTKQLSTAAPCQCTSSVAKRTQSPARNGAAVAAGLGLTVRTEIGMPAEVQALPDHAALLPQLPRLGLMVYRSEGAVSPSIAYLEHLLRDAIGL